MIDDEWLDPHYSSTYSCILYVHFFVHSLIEFHFYASLSLKQAVVWRARRGKHNHGALWLVMDLHNSSWISIDDFRNWIMGLHNWIYGDSWFELWSSISFDLWWSITHNSIHWALQFAVMELQTICGDPSSTWWSAIIYNVHRPTMELHDWNVDGVS